MIDGRIYFQTSSKKLKPARVIYHRSQKGPGGRTHTEITISDGKEVDEIDGSKSEAIDHDAQNQPEIAANIAVDNSVMTQNAQDNRDVDAIDKVNETERDVSAKVNTRTNNSSDRLLVARSSITEKHDVVRGNENKEPMDINSRETEKKSAKDSPDKDNTSVNPVHVSAIYLIMVSTLHD